MRAEIANRLAELRKLHNLSQEELAARLGVSRQAVSKWERAESSPDTDNLIALARLYGVSLDELVFGTEPAPRENAAEGVAEGVADAQEATDVKAKARKYVSVGPAGVHVIKDGREVHIGPQGVNVRITTGGSTGDPGENRSDCDTPDYHTVTDCVSDCVNDCMDDVMADGRVRVESPAKNLLMHKLPVSILVTASYFVMGFAWNLWHPGWLVFFAIPIYYETVTMCLAKTTPLKLNLFPIVLLCVVAYLFLGSCYGLWHPTWMLFLLIPIYYSLVNIRWKRQG